jgi:hypothetical protein
MKTYVIVTGILFGVLAILHAWRAFLERSSGEEPFFVGITVLTAVLCAWAFSLVVRGRRV